jgi:hypothetical protein
MSYSTLYAFDTDGNATEFTTYKNSHGFCAFVFGAMDKVYEEFLFKDPFLGIKSWLFGGDEYWANLNACDLKWWEYNTVRFCYDKYIVTSENLEILALSLEKFAKEHSSPNKISHLNSIAADLRKIASDENFIAVGMCGTSCGDDVWIEYNEEDDECHPYNIKTNNNHTEFLPKKSDG